MLKEKIIKIYTSNERANWNHLKIIHKIHDKDDGKVRNQLITATKRTAHCVYTSKSANVSVQSV